MNKKHAFIGLVVVCLLVCALVWAWQAREDKKFSQVPVQAGLEESFRDLKVEIAKRFAPICSTRMRQRHCSRVLS